MNPKPVCLDDFRKYAKKHLSEATYEYFETGADDEITVQDNVESFKRWRMRPRLLRDVSKIDLTTTILGHEIAFPVCIAPLGFNGLAHPSAEPATAKGAQNAGVGYTLSIHATKSMEDVAKQVPDVLRFLQIYSAADRSLTLEHMRRAEKSGYDALVLTLDAPVFSKRRADVRNQFWSQPLPNFGFGNLIPHETETERFLKPADHPIDKRKNFDRHITPELLRFWVKETRLPVIAKGILTAEDAKLVVECGVSGVIVSNHGGRQLDTVLSTIDALPEVVAAVNGRCEVYLDGGVRNGTDIFKALALGAKAVFIGRPSVYALAYNGTEGVTAMLQMLKEEFNTTMTLAGCSSVSEIKRGMVVHESAYKSRL